MRRSRGRSFVAALALGWLGGCDRGDPERGALDGSWIDTSPPVYVPVADETLDRFVDTLALIASLDWGFGGALDEHAQLSAPTSADQRAVIERGVASARFVADPACASTMWEGGRATVRLDLCRLGISARRVSGAVGLEVVDGALVIALGDLVIRDTAFDGHITLRATEPPSMSSRGVGGAVQYPDVEGTTTLTFTGSVSFTTFTPLHDEGVSLVLQGSWSGAAGTAELGGQASFVPGDCLPSDGFVVFRGAPFAFETRLGFGLSTPDDHRWGANTLTCD
jgi:hypothetical protein